MNPWYRSSFRRNLVDMHIDDWNDEFLRDFDPDAYVECLRMAKIQSPMIYTQSHVGLCNWDTKSGRTHRAFLGNHKLKRLFDLCHAQQMDVVAYYSLIYNNCAYEDHPEWRMLHMDGSPSRSDPAHGFMSGGRYGLLCPNHPGYRRFVKEQLSELCIEFDFEGIFLDMTFWPIVCHCPSCRERYKSETGDEIPIHVDWNDPRWVQFQLLRQHWMGEFAAYCSDILENLKPAVTIEHQFSTICHHWVFGVDEKVNDANEYAGGDLYGGFQQQSYICKVFREASKNQPFEYMTSRCDPALRVHTTTKSLRDLKRHNYLTLAHHGAFLVIDAIDPVGTLNPDVYQRIGQVFTESIPYEAYMTGELVSEAALIMSYDSKFNPYAKVQEPDQADQSHPQLVSQIGMSRILKNMGMTYTVLPNNKLDDLKSKKLAMLTHASLLREKEIGQIVEYVNQGGALYLSGATDQRLVHQLLGLVKVGVTKENETYLAPTGAYGSVFGEEYSVKYPLSFQNRQVMVENPQSHEVLAHIVLPYTDPADRSVFASIHSNPPGILTQYPAIVMGKYGKGRVLWSSCTLEDMEQPSYQEIVTRLIRLLAVPSVVQTDVPECVEMTLFRDGNRYIMHAVNMMDSVHVLPLGVIHVSLCVEEEITRIMHVPDGRSIAYDRTQNGVTFSIPDMDLFETYVLEFGVSIESLKDGSTTTYHVHTDFMK